MKDFDVAFPVLHGLYGEDGKIQGMFEMLNIPYVGCNVLSSAIAMDKVYQKKLFKQTGIKQTKYVYLRYDIINIYMLMICLMKQRWTFIK